MPISLAVRDIEELDSNAHRLYIDAHRFLVRLGDMYAQPGALNLTEALAQVGHVIQQLIDLDRSAFHVQRTVADRYGMNQYALFSSLYESEMDAIGISELCARSIGRISSDGPGKGSETPSFNSILSAATAMRADIDSFNLWGPRLPPAVRLGSGVHSEIDADFVPGQSSSNDGLLPWQQEYLDALLSFSPTSILGAFPPPPADPPDWATFYHNCSPVSLGKQPSALVQSSFLRVQLPPPPQVGASAQEVAAYVSETKAQLGVSFHALAPVAAAISHRPEPWVGCGQGDRWGWRLLHCHAFLMLIAALQKLNTSTPWPSNSVTLLTQSDPELPLLSPEQRQLDMQLARCLADQPHLIDWIERQVSRRMAMQACGQPVAHTDVVAVFCRYM
jgi:hypothetical protein